MTKMARRDFLKFSAAGVAGAAFASTLSASVFTPEEKAMALVNLTFSSNTSHTLRNPERGWFYDLIGNWSTNDVKWYTQGELANIRDQHNVTLFRQYYQLDDYLNSAISQTYLDNVTGMFQKVRAVGCKIIPRFRYVWNTESLNTRDASLSRIQGHLSQLKPVIDANVDVIDHVQAGWVGHWGEWHNSSSEHEVNGVLQPSGVTIAHNLLDWTPSNRQVAFRYPRHVRYVWGNNFLAASEAYTGTQRSRVGFHIDGFSRDASSWNTFNQSADRDYVRSFGAYTIQTGEPGQDTTYARNNWYDEIKWFGCHSMNINQPDPAVAGLYTFVKDNGQFNALHRELGYRMRLTTANLPDSVKPGHSFPLTLKFKNDGFARPHNARRLIIMLRNKATGQKFDFPYTETDVRLALPAGGGQTSTANISPTVPASAPEGTYDVIVWLPDPYPSLRNRPEYAIQLANVGTWEATTGFNVIYRQLSVGRPRLR
jgi:hypothetical protein